VQRVIVFLDLLSTSRPHDQSDRDIRRQRELKRGTQIHAVAGGDRSKLLALFDDDRRNFEIILSVVVTRALEDGSRWQIFPGDLDVTLGWTPEADITLLKVDDEVASHVLISDSGPVRVIAVGQSWGLSEVKFVLRDG
jgi:hypothetical protein